MGRPKKVNTNTKELQTQKLQSQSQELQTQESQSQTSNQISKLNKYPKCEICNTPILSSPYIANLSYITGVSLYHRDIPDRIKMCDKCADKFSKYVEKWLVQNGIKSRLEIIAESKAEEEKGSKTEEEK